MSRNGSGVYSLVAGNPVTSGTAISSTWANNTLTDIANALTGSLASDGQTSLTGNLNFGTNKASNMADPTLAQDAVTLNYLTTQDVGFGGNITAPTQTTGNNTTRVSTTAFVKTAIDAAIQLLYPIGSIYTSTVSTNPNTLFGFGTWTAFGSGKVLIGNGGGFTAGDTGGSADAIVVSHTHTATVTDPGHFHNAFNGFTVAGGDTGTAMTSNSTGSNVPTNSTSTKTTGITVANTSTGVSGTNANLQPYIVVYMWNRTA
jgi:hypothetical protein